MFELFEFFMSRLYIPSHVNFEHLHKKFELYDHTIND